MSPTQHRLEIFIDIFDEKNQRAWPLPEIRPTEFIASILQEFRGPAMSYLGDDPVDYLLVRSDGGASLNADTPLGDQLNGGEHLILREHLPQIPPGSRTTSRRLYLRELSNNRIFRIFWVPAIIGRPDPSMLDNELLAVNLRNMETGSRVSRRHARIIEENNVFFIQSLSPNPTTVRHKNEDTPIPVDSELIPLTHGDLISLERSHIKLQVIIREESATFSHILESENMSEDQASPAEKGGGDAS